VNIANTAMALRTRMNRLLIGQRHPRFVLA
jgi:hypothetical protein